MKKESIYLILFFTLLSLSIYANKERTIDLAEWQDQVLAGPNGKKSGI